MGDMEDHWQEASEHLTGKVTLEITGGQGDITTKHEADGYFRNGSYYLLFEENISEDGKAGNISFSSRLKISRDRVSLKRRMKGQGTKAPGHSMEMVYEMRGEEERGCLIDYPTPYGILKMEIRTKAMEVSLREKQLVAEIEYLLLQEDMEAGKDKLRIKVTGR